MSKTVELTIEDRYMISIYAPQIPSSAAVYFAYPEFSSKISISDEEQAQYEVKVLDDGTISSNAPEKLFTINTDELPNVIMDTIRNYVEDKTKEMEDLREANKENPYYKDSELYTNIIKYLSKLI